MERRPGTSGSRVYTDCLSSERCYAVYMNRGADRTQPVKLGKNETQEEFADCPLCLNLPEAIGEFDRRPALDDPGEVKGWPGLVHATDHKHIVDAGNIIAPYQLRQLVRCSLGAHEHKSGFIVRTRCDLVLQLGWKCARNSIHGYDKALEHLRQQDKHFANVDDAKRIPPECRALLEELVPKLTKYAEYQAAKRTTSEGRLMMARSRRGARGTEVPVRRQAYDPKTGKRYTETTIVRIEGMEYWHMNLDLRAPEAWLEEATRLEEETLSLDPNDRELAAELARRSRSLQKGTAHVQGQVRICEQYLSRVNRAVVSAALQAG